MISILLCMAFVFVPMAISTNTKANSEKSINKVLASTEDDVPLYSFGLLSDLHIQYETGKEDFIRALVYLRDKVPFTCVCGDLVSYATAENMAEYKECVDSFAGSMPLYECSGNHDTYDFVNGEVKAGVLTGELLKRWQNATGKEHPNYSFEYGEDVFVFLSLKSDNPDDMFVDGGLQWLSETLEKNKNKRCFVFQHVQNPEDDTADPSHSYSDILNGISGEEFLRIIEKYDNTVWFHGHTHLTFQGEYTPINEAFGYRSVHIPSLASPRFYDEKLNVLENFYLDEYNNKIWGALLSEGYIVDVYADKIVLRGINFASGDSRNQVEALANKVFTLDTTFVYAEPEETTTATSEPETETTKAPELTTVCTSSLVTEPAETESSQSATEITESTETDPSQTTIAETESKAETETATFAQSSTIAGTSALLSEPETEAPIGILGDANGDTRVNIKDATLIRKVAAKIFTLSEKARICADVNTDGKVNVKDATLIQKYSANLQTGKPIGQPV